MGTVCERKHRLPSAAYVGLRTVVFTACVKHRARLFDDLTVVAEFTKTLLRWAESYECDVVAYCFMPDHLHIMLRGRSSTSCTKRAFDEFKLTTGLWLAENRPQMSWQKDYYDHIVRSGDDWRRQALYILANPVRARIVEYAPDYLFSGSSLGDKKDLFDGLAW